MNGPTNSEAKPHPMPSFQNATSALPIQIRPQTALLFSSWIAAMLLPGDGRPQCGQASAASETVLLQSGHEIAAIPHPRRKYPGKGLDRLQASDQAVLVQSSVPATIVNQST